MSVLKFSPVTEVRRTVSCLFLQIDPDDPKGDVWFGYHWSPKAAAKGETNHTTVGGGMHLNESPWDAAEREAREEYGSTTANQTDFHELDMESQTFTAADGTLKEYVPVLAIYRGKRQNWTGTEVESMHWIKLDDFDSLTCFSPSKQAFLTDMIAYVRQNHSDLLKK